MKSQKKTLDFVVIREEPGFPSEKETSNIRLDNKINSHPYLPIY
jgi:hypothetical protein